MFNARRLVKITLVEPMSSSARPSTIEIRAATCSQLSTINNAWENFSQSATSLRSSWVDAARNPMAAARR